MKLTVIKIINDGVIAVNKSNVVCFDESSIMDDLNERRMDVYVGQVLTNKNFKNSDFFWWYSRKEWDLINDGIKNL
jgi:hypothetical protein